MIFLRQFFLLIALTLVVQYGYPKNHESVKQLLEQASQANELGLFTHAILIYQELLGRSDLTEKERIITELYLCETQRATGEFVLAIRTAKAAIKEAEQQGLDDLAYYGYNRIAAAYYEAKEADKCREALAKSYAYEEKLDSRVFHLSNVTIEGAILRLEGNVDEAIDLFKKSIQEATAIQDWDEVLTAQLQLADTYIHAQQFELALDCLTRCLNTIDKLPEHPRQAPVFLKLMEVHRELGNLEEALNYSDQYYLFNEKQSFAKQRESVVYLSNQIAFHEAEHNRELLEMKNAENEKWTDYFIALIVALIIILFLLAMRIYSSRRVNRELKMQNEKITEQRNELNKLISARERTFSIISHDLKGPAGSIMGGLKLLASGELSEEEKSVFTQTLANESEHLFNLLNQLLEWSVTIRAGLKPKIEVISTPDILREVQDQIQVLANQKEVFLKIDCEPCNIEADKNMIEGSLRNLLSNAIKFSKREQTIDLDVRCSNGFATFTVTDHGVGMSNEQLARLNRSDINTTEGTEKEKGTGLGLEMVMKYLELHHSHLKVHSTPGKGSTFSFKIKLAEA